jgi:hypothetical protein
MAQPDSPTPLYAHTNDIIATDVDGEVILLNPKSWNFFEFDRIGGSIWKHLETPRSLPSLVDTLMVDFDVDQARCLGDTKIFLDALIAHGLVAVVDG